MSMTKSDFMERYRTLLWDYNGCGPEAEMLAALAEEAGVEWDTEQTPEPTGDLSMVRVIDAVSYTWKPRGTSWARIGSAIDEPWSEIPQPVTVLRPEGDQS